MWGDAFVLDGDRLRDHNPNAAYTRGVYDLNDPRKVKMRRRRRTTIREALDLIKRGPSTRDHLLEKAAETGDPELVEAARLIEKNLKKAWQDLKLFQVVPQDARSSCACDDEERCAVPQVLSEQAIDIDSPF